MDAYTAAAEGLDQMKLSVARDEGKLEQIQQDLESLLGQKESMTEEINILGEVMGIFQTLESEGFQQFEDRLAILITRGLTLVFGEPIEFVLEGKTHGDLSALAFHLKQGDLVTDVLGAKGGGVVGVVGFLLRVLVLLAHRPSLRPFMVLDETFSHLSSEYVPNMANLLRELADQTGIQFIMVTHEPAFGDAADVVYEVSQTNGVSDYRQIKSHQEHICE